LAAEKKGSQKTENTDGGGKKQMSKNKCRTDMVKNKHKQEPTKTMPHK
jgi:hypothetical protein